MAAMPPNVMSGFDINQLKIPSTPLVLGFSANVGQNLFLQKRVKSAKDDLRFFFGTRFDVGRLLGQLQQFR